MKTVLAAYATVHDYPGGAAEVAEGLGIGKQVLINKVNPQNTTHHLTLGEAERLIQFTQDMRILHALADEVGGIFIPLSKNGDARAVSVVNDIGRMSQDFGALLKEVADDIQDGVISANELKRIQNEASDLRATLAILMADIAAMYEAAQQQGTKKRTQQQG